MNNKVTLANVQALVNENPRAHLPEWILTTARELWKEREDRFLRTNCQATCARLRHLIFPDETRWLETRKQPLCGIYMVQFGQDHEFTVIKDRVLQSYAFQHEVEEREYDPRQPYYAHISHDAQAYRYLRPTFLVPCPDPINFILFYSHVTNTP